MSLDTIRNEHLRLAVLHLLAQDPGYDLNENILADSLREFGHQPGRDKLRTELAWLAEQGLVAVDELPGLRLARLTSRGADVAAGRALVPGVRRPGPEGL